jgi:cysteine sulfinate desulfinase/cysteine desulfurase-like protein
MGVPADVARSSLRITLGHANTMADIEVLLEKLPVAVQKLRALAPLSQST